MQWTRADPTRAASFDHLVGASKQRLRHVDAECLGGLQIYHQFVLGRRLYRQVARPCALEDAGDIPARAPMLVEEIGAVGNETADGSEIACTVDSWQSMLGRQH